MRYYNLYPHVIPQREYLWITDHKALRHLTNRPGVGGSFLVGSERSSCDGTPPSPTEVAAMVGTTDTSGGLSGFIMSKMTCGEH